jgi:HK97 family phage major capsid protein
MVLPFYYANTILEKIGVSRMPMSKYEVKIPIMGTFSNPTAVAKYTGATENTATFTDVTLKASDYKDIVIIGSDLLEMEAYNILPVVQQQLGAKFRAYMDNQFLYGTGASDTQLGIESQILSGNTFGTAGSTLANIKADLLKCLSKVADTDLPINSATSAWLMTPSQYYYLLSLSTSTGDDASFLLPLQSATPTLFGYKVVLSTTVGNSKVFFGDWSYVYFGIRKELALNFEFEGTFTLGGTVYDGKDVNKSALRMFGSYGNVLAYPSAVSGITSVSWA